jgi:ribonuclease Z
MGRPQRSRSAGARLLFDAGRGVVLQMTRAGIPVEEVGPVFVTHHHYDHIGDLADVILTGWLQGRRRPLTRIVGPPGHRVDRDGAARTACTTRTSRSARRASMRSSGGPSRAPTSRRGWSTTAAPGGSSPSRWCTATGSTTRRASKRRWVCLGYRVEAEGKIVAFSGDLRRVRRPPAPGPAGPTSSSSAATWARAELTHALLSFAWPGRPSRAREQRGSDSPGGPA